MAPSIRAVDVVASWSESTSTSPSRTLRVLGEQPRSGLRPLAKRCQIIVAGKLVLAAHDELGGAAGEEEVADAEIVDEGRGA